MYVLCWYHVFVALNLVQVLLVKAWPELIEHGSFRHGSHGRGLELLKINVQLFQQPRTERLFSLVALISILHIYLNSFNVYQSKNTNMTFFVKTKAGENVNANLYKKNI